MNTELTIRNERVDDIPLLVAQQCRMGIPDILDRIVQPHGNRTGLSVGMLSTFWLTYILSEADHRMSEVESWAAGVQETLAGLADGPVAVKDFTDDRLADVLKALADDGTWDQIEEQLGQRLVRVYDLPAGPIRLDSTSVAVYHDGEGSALFRHGHSKDHRPDLAQFKIMLAALDPLGLPLATLVVPGNQADDGLYLPAITAARRVVGTGGRLYVGDAKMGALATRARLAADGDYYLMPLAQTGGVPALLAACVERVGQKAQPVVRIEAPEPAEAEAAEPPALLALAFETPREQTATVADQRLTWTERLVVVYSPTLARELRQNLAERLEKAEAALRALTPPVGRGHRQPADRASLEAAVGRLLQQHRVEGLLAVTLEEQTTEQVVRGYRGQPARQTVQVHRRLTVRRNAAAVRQARRLLGWRLYVTNAPAAVLGLAAVVLAYRGASRIERNFHRFKGKPLGLRPVLVQRADHARGLVRLLSLAVRVLTVVEHVVRAALATAGEALRGLYAGNPTRATARPTTERLLKALKGITLTVIEQAGQTVSHLTALNPPQRQIISLLGLPASLYDDLPGRLHPNPP